MTVNLGGKSNRIKWRLKSSYNVMAMKYEVYNLEAKFFLNECEIRESGDIVSIGLDVSNPNACKFELQDGKYNLRDIIQLRLFTVDVTRAYISTKLLSLSFKEEVIQSNQYILTISK